MKFNFKVFLILPVTDGKSRNKLYLYQKGLMMRQSTLAKIIQLAVKQL